MPANADYRALGTAGAKEIKMFVQNQNRKEVVDQYPCATKIVKVDGGYMVFYSVIDYKVWKNQK